MSYLAFHTRTQTVQLPGRQIHQVLDLATQSLETCLRRPRHTRLRYELGLPDVDSPFFSSQILWVMLAGEPSRAFGHDIHLMGLGLQLLYEQAPAAGVLCWVFDTAISHGWVAGPDRAAMAAELQAAASTALPASWGEPWEPVITFLRDGTGDAVTSLSHGSDFPGRHLPVKTGTWQPPVQNSADPDGELEELWEQLDASQQWDLAMAALQTQPDLRWHPGSYQFSRLTLDPDPSGPDGLIPAGTHLATT